MPKKQETKKESLVTEKSNLPAPLVSLALETMDIESVAVALAESGIDGFSPFDLDKISMPAAGAMTYRVPTEEGARPAEHLDAIIIHHHATRQYYAGDYDAANPSPPSCASYDGVTGQGDPGGSCAVCPLGQFGGPCKPYRFLYLLFPDKTVPTLFVLPRTSLSGRLPKGIKKYTAKLAFKGKTLGSVLSHIGLEDRKQGAGSVAVFEEGQTLSKEHVALVRQYAQAFKGALSFPSAPPAVDDPTKGTVVSLYEDQLHSDTSTPSADLSTEDEEDIPESGYRTQDHAPF